MEITRAESERLRMRKNTDKGTDIALALPSGRRLSHGDVVYLSEKMIVINIAPEKVAVVRMKDINLRTAVLLGHVIGNLHRPIKMEPDRVILPIQSESEIEMLRKKLGPLASSVEITSDLLVFEPEADSHEH